MARFTEERMFEKLGELTPSKKTRVTKTACPLGYYWDMDLGECVKIETPQRGTQDAQGNIRYANTLIKGYKYPPNTNAASAWETEKNQFAYAADDVDSWYNQWYAGRMTKPEFAQLAEQRLNATVNRETPYVLQAQPSFSKQHNALLATTYVKKVNDPANKPFENKIFLGSAVLPDSGDNDSYNAEFINPKNARKYIFDELLHEKTHWDDNNYPQPGTARHSVKDDVVLNSVLPKEYLVPGEGLIWDASKGELSLDFNKNLSKEELDYLSHPTEVRARLNMWRQMNNISPMKDYHPSEINAIIKKNINELKNNPDKASDYRNILELYHLIHGDPKILKELNDKYVSNDSDQELDLAQYGGEPKYPGGGEVELQGLRYRKDESGKFFYLSGAPVTDTLLIQKLTYEGKPVGSSPAVSSIYPKPDIRTTDMKIADTKKQGMAYQSTANQLKPLQKQKEKEVADAKAEQYKLAQQSFERTVGADNTRFVPQVTPIEFKVETPWEQEAAITKRYKEMARHIIANGQHIAVGLDKEYLSSENSHRPGGPLSLEELVIERLKKDPDFLMKDFIKREQKMYDQAPWYMKVVNDIAAFGTDPITTVERAVFDFERPLMFQALQSLNPDQFGGDSEFYNRGLRRDENVLNNAFNYINPLRYGASAGLKAYDGNYLGAAGDIATGYLMGKTLPGMARGAGAAVTNIAKAPLLGLEGLPAYATYGNAANLYFGKHALTENLPNALEQYYQGNIGEGNRELFYTALGVTPLAMEREALAGLVKDLRGSKAAKSSLVSGTEASGWQPYTDAVTESVITKLAEENPAFEYLGISPEEAEALRKSNVPIDKRTVGAWPVRGYNAPAQGRKLNMASQQQAFDESTQFAKEWLLGENADKYDELFQTKKDLDIARDASYDALKRATNDFVAANEPFEAAHGIDIATAEDVWLEEQMIAAGYGDELEALNNGKMLSYEADQTYNELIKKLGKNDIEVKQQVYDILAKSNPEMAEKLKPVQDALGNFFKVMDENNQLVDEYLKASGELGNLKLDPTFQKKIDKLFKDANAGKTDIKDIQHHMGSGIQNTDLSKRSKLVHLNEEHESFKALSSDDKKYLLDNYEKIGGVRTGDNTITLASKPGQKVMIKGTPATGGEPVYIDVTLQDMYTPERIAEVNAHEIGHDFQRLFPGFNPKSGTTSAWIDLLQDYNGSEYGYYVSSDKNPVAKLFKEVLVEPKKLEASDIAAGTRYHQETWQGAPNELHSDLMIARQNIVDDLVNKQGYTMRDAVQLLKNEEDYYLDYIMNHPDVAQHFKPDASVETKKLVLKYLPMLVPAVGLGVAGSMGTETLPENKYGGNIKNLSKFIRK